MKSRCLILLMASIVLFASSCGKTEVTGNEDDIFVTVTFLNEDGTVDFTKEVKKGQCFEEIPNGSNPEGLLQYWERFDSYETLTTSTPILEDVTYRPTYLSIEELIELYTSTDSFSLADINPDELDKLADYIENK